MLKLSSCHGPVPSGRTKRLTEALRMVDVAAMSSSSRSVSPSRM